VVAQETEGGLTVLFPLAAALLFAIAEEWRWAAWLALVASGPLAAGLRGRGFLRIWLGVILFYAVFTCATLRWVGRPSAAFYAVLPAVAVYSIPFLALPAAALRWLSGVPRAIGFAAAFAAAELLARLLFFRITWATLGLPLADYGPFRRLAAFGGPEALTFAAVLAGCCLYEAVETRGRWQWVATAAVVAGLIGAALLSVPRAAGEGSLELAVVQPVVSQRSLPTPAARTAMLARMKQLAVAAPGGRSTAILLPEGALLPMVRFDTELAAFARGIVAETGRPLLFGSLDRDEGRYFNAAFLITPFGEVESYRKLRPVPVVEYVPAWAPMRAAGGFQLASGGDAPPLNVPFGNRVGAMICVEDTMPDVARAYRRAGAQALAALVNTENYLGTAQSLQHLRRAQLTAASVGLPMARAANSGISGVIDGTGRVIEALPEGVETSASFHVPTPLPLTVYAAAGDGGALAVFGVIIAVCGVISGMRRREALR
jgi:apolipoprotein N-acyltransferase